ncbi:unnamed protein product [Dovyalis caffra]|uniref:Uncharacterized protein n=1 Tax=Dovyalis caffra TaxID=77055 RepID=A0AAV1RMQ8_9ROSI|nr:unnamed protein product [Dovyalis caffra]
MGALLSRFDHRALIWCRSWHTESAKVGTHGVFHLCKDVVVFLENVMREVPALATPTDHSATTSFSKDGTLSIWMESPFLNTLIPLGSSPSAVNQPVVS